MISREQLHVTTEAVIDFKIVFFKITASRVLVSQ